MSKDKDALAGEEMLHGQTRAELAAVQAELGITERELMDAEAERDRCWEQCNAAWVERNAAEAERDRYREALERIAAEGWTFGARPGAERAARLALAALRGGEAKP